MFKLYVSESIELRMLSARDSDPLFEIIEGSRNYLKNWLPWLETIRTSHDALEYIKATFFSYNNRTAISAGIFYNKKLVGVVGYNTLDFRNKIGSIGYWLDEKAQGKGIMTQSIESLITHGFESLKLNRIEIRVAEGNCQSRKIPEKLHFKYEGKIRDAEWLYDHYVDHIIYSILQKEWT